MLAQSLMFLYKLQKNNIIVFSKRQWTEMHDLNVSKTLPEKGSNHHLKHLSDQDSTHKTFLSPIARSQLTFKEGKIFSLNLNLVHFHAPCTFC